MKPRHPVFSHRTARNAARSIARSPARLAATALLAAALLIGLAGCANPTIEKRDVVYGQAEGVALRLDIVEPAAPARGLRGAVVMVHGGAWSAGDKRDFRDGARWLAGLGYVVFNINYRLVTAEKHHWPAQLEDAQRAIRWVRAHAAEYHVDPNRVAAMGGSAGGHIVACLAVTEAPPSAEKELTGISSRPTCIVSLAGPTDLRDDFAAKVKQGAWTREQVAFLLGRDPASDAAFARSASPLFSVDARTSPALVIQGKTDEVVPWDHAKRFHDALTQSGVKSRLVLLEGGHGLEGKGSFETMVNETTLFLQETIGK